MHSGVQLRNVIWLSNYELQIANANKFAIYKRGLCARGAAVRSYI